MKKDMAVKYPHSANLFQFCRKVLDHKFGGIRVIDQDVGQILGFDPADCSHWKKGKKNIRALSTLRSIADHLNIDERLLIDIAAGKVNLEEAVFEFKGYGSFALTGRHLENLKKEFFKNPARWQQEQGSPKSFEELFDIDRDGIVKAAEKIIEMGRFTEAPIYLPEVFQLFEGVKLESDPELKAAVERHAVANESGTEATTLKFRGPEMRPYVRYGLARELWKHLLHTQHELVKAYQDAPSEVQEIQANIFAGALLIPGTMLRREVERVDSSLDLILQLAETFWTSKALMNQRLCDYMEHLS